MSPKMFWNNNNFIKPFRCNFLGTFSQNSIMEFKSSIAFNSVCSQLAIVTSSLGCLILILHVRLYTLKGLRKTGWFSHWHLDIFDYHNNALSMVWPGPMVMTHLLHVKDNVSCQLHNKDNLDTALYLWYTDARHCLTSWKGVDVLKISASNSTLCLHAWIYVACILKRNS